MRKLIIIILLLGALGLSAAFGINRYLTGGTGGDISTTTPGVLYPDISGNIPTQPVNSGKAPAGTTLTIAVQGNQSLIVSDFITGSGASSTNQIEPVILVGGSRPIPGETTASVFFDRKSQTFNVTLLKEPLSIGRLEAEQQLRTILGIAEGDMCRLNYWVGVPYSVNQNYAGKNLGFSFCPGATQL